MKRSTATLISLLAVSPVMPNLAQSQDQQSKNKGAVALEEIIVTANRREQNLQDVAISVAAFTAEFFKNSGTANLGQLDRVSADVDADPAQVARGRSHCLPPC